MIPTHAEVLQLEIEEQAADERRVELAGRFMLVLALIAVVVGVTL